MMPTAFPLHAYDVQSAVRITDVGHIMRHAPDLGQLMPCRLCGTSITDMLPARLIAFARCFQTKEILRQALMPRMQAHTYSRSPSSGCGHYQQPPQ